MPPDVILCPSCQAPLTGGPSCTSCGLPLQGPAAARLWQIDQRLAAVTAEQSTLKAERERLLAALRKGDTVAATDAFVFATGGSAARPADPFVGSPVAARPVKHEAAPHQVQNTLLTLGALLLAVAGIVFAAVTYQKVGPVGRALILLALTGAAAVAPQRLRARSLTASAEALAGVALVLAVLDAWVLRRAGVADDVEGLSYAAVATGLLALAAGAYAVAVPLRVSRIATVLLAQLPVVLVLARTEPSWPVVATVLAVLAAVDVVVAAERRLPKDARLTAAGMAGVGALSSLMASVAAVQQDDRGAGFGLLVLALLLAAGSIRIDDLTARAIVSGVSVPLLAAAAWATARDDLTTTQEPLVLPAVALLAVTIAGLLPLFRRHGPIGGGLAVLVVALVTQGEAILMAVVGPLTWFADPWSRTAESARDTVSLDDRWTGTVVTLVIVAGTAVCLAMAGLLLEETDAVVVPVGVLVTVSAMLLPLGLSFTYLQTIAALVALTAVAAAGSRFSRGTYRLLLLGMTAALGTFTAVWSVADRDATLVVLPLLAVLAGVVAVWASAAAGVAALLAGAALLGFGADAGLSQEKLGCLLLLAPAACVAASYLLRWTRRVAVEVAALLLSATAVSLASVDPTCLSVTLGVSGVLALAVAIRPDRHDVGLLGGLLLTAASWVRLADADVEAPEPYAAPLAITALVFGHLRRRSGQASSFEAYGAGLTAALVPSLLKALADDSATRGLLLLLVCVGVVLAGAAWKLRAPLVIGGGVLVIDALDLLGPFARAMPRWSLLALAGTVLVGVGVTYEARRRDLARLKEQYERLS